MLLISFTLTLGYTIVNVMTFLHYFETEAVWIYRAASFGMEFGDPVGETLQRLLAEIYEVKIMCRSFPVYCRQEAITIA